MTFNIHQRVFDRNGMLMEEVSLYFKARNQKRASKEPEKEVVIRRPLWSSFELLPGI